VTDPPIRIVIVDDHPVARYGMRQIFASAPGIEVAGEAETLAGLADLDAQADVLVLDLYLGQARLTAGQIAALAGTCPVLVVSASVRREDVIAAVRAGASGYLVKTAERDVFIEAVRTVAGHGFYVSAQLAHLIDASLEAGDDDAREVRLAPRERQVLSLIAQGFTQAQAATRLGVSQGTVDTYIKRIRAKLGPGNKADLTRRAIELGEIDPEP
jgi:two-component system, NarL family, nitrate/nitrite response regulator NarL